VTRKDYKKLVKNTYSFTQLDAGRQREILNAKGEEMLGYAKMFQEENEIMTKTIEDFNKSNEKEVFEFKVFVKKGEHSKRRASEEAEKTEDEQVLNSLLNKI
jgi:hypothetical protein